MSVELGRPVPGERVNPFHDRPCVAFYRVGAKEGSCGGMGGNGRPARAWECSSEWGRGEGCVVQLAEVEKRGMCAGGGPEGWSDSGRGMGDGRGPSVG